MRLTTATEQRLCPPGRDGRVAALTAGRLLCRHCRVRVVSRPRQLCWRDYYRPGVRDLYPPGSASPATAKYVSRSLLGGSDPTEVEVAALAAEIRAGRQAGRARGPAGGAGVVDRGGE